MINMIVLFRPFAILFFVIFLTIHVSFGNSKSDILCSESEKQALLSFKQNLVDPLNVLVSWVVEEDCCNWAGIHCHNLTGYVEKINLASAAGRSALKGKVSPSLLNLKHLTHLDLSYNDFGGIQIPSFIGSFANLRYLNLAYAEFTGPIPHQIGNLSSLRHLALPGSYNSFPTKYSYLHVKNLHWLSGLSSLEYLDMSHVHLSKASNHWSLVVNMLHNLSELRLSYCQLGHIPSLTYVNFTSISVFDIQGNNFYSFIPKWFFNLSNLVHLDLSDSKFRGPIPNGNWSLNSLTSLSLSRNQLNSSIPNWLFGLNSLVSLYLSHNALQGPIPCGFLNLTALKFLSLSVNHFGPTIPSCVYYLSSLEFLGLGSNKFEGVISSAIGNLTSIVTLHSPNNSLQGQIPRTIGNLCNLKRITLNENKLSGKISEAFKRLSGCLSNSLVSLALKRNLFSGQITDEIAEFKKLEDLDISWNQLNGSLPENLGSLSNLKVLDVSSNFMEGVVSEVHFANMTNLNSLLASGNSLILKVTSRNWIPPFLQLEQINLRSWRLGPQFPIWLKSLTHIWDIDLSNTGISDTIPSWFWNVTSSFLSLNLSHNQIHGQLPDFLDYSPSTTIYLGSNKFTGPLPRISSKIAELDLSNNSFSGDISHLLCHPVTFSTESSNLKILHLGENHLSGSIPDCWTKWPLLRVIKLSNNNLTGEIPSSIGALHVLLSLNLRNNKIFGEIPMLLRNCTSLIAIDLGLNDLVGNIPKWVGSSLSNLKFLSLRSNKLNGQIPHELCDLSSLQILDFAHNDLSGTIPRCFNNFRAMARKQQSSELISYSMYPGKFIENAFVVRKGREDQYNTILMLVTSLDLSSNRLSGKIRDQLTTLTGLLSLNLSKNQLEGTIPYNIGNMMWMESLDLSMNQLSGKIPSSISSLTFLNYLNLSFNRLYGEIPLSTQLQSLDASGFVGNELCGPPLTKDCRVDDATSPSTTYAGQNELLDWFHCGIATGFTVGFLGVIGPSVLFKSWRNFYFSFFSHFHLCGTKS